jgi:hypothetical protein
VINVECARLVQTAERIVGKRRQVNDRIEPTKISRFDVSNILSEDRVRLVVWAEIAAFIEKRVQARDVVPRSREDTCHDRPDVPVMTRNQYFH